MRETKQNQILNAALRGLVASLYILLMLVVVARDYQVMAFLRFYSIGVLSLIVVVAFFARLLANGVRSRIGYALLGVLLIWATAFVLAPL